MNVLKEWWSLANPAERAQLAKKVRTTQESLRMMAFSYKTEGVLHISADMAGRLEQATTELHAVNPALPALFRGDLCQACGACPYAQLCSTGKEAGK